MPGFIARDIIGSRFEGPPAPPPLAVLGQDRLTAVPRDVLGRFEQVRRRPPARS